MIVLGADAHKRSHTVAAVAGAIGELLGEQTVQPCPRRPDTRIIIALCFGSTARLAGFGGPKRGHVCRAADDRLRPARSLLTHCAVRHAVQGAQIGGRWDTRGATPSATSLPCQSPGCPGSRLASARCGDRGLWDRGGGLPRRAAVGGRGVLRAASTRAAICIGLLSAWRPIPSQLRAQGWRRSGRRRRAARPQRLPSRPPPVRNRLDACSRRFGGAPRDRPMVVVVARTDRDAERSAERA
jgi:hypothetical protein